LHGRSAQSPFFNQTRALGVFEAGKPKPSEG
jgi:hypothetical protein